LIIEFSSVLIISSFEIRKKVVPDLPEPYRRSVAKKHNMQRCY